MERLDQFQTQDILQEAEEVLVLERALMGVVAELLMAEMQQ
tara:strand:+ start:314 stop:436 length:123 start_codon:yes stop_codon:yes gene_type:complete